ncbi:WD40 repeat [Trinorchestia longiramus]|nr:WD40 repeat [Trinorchestia longiramus]
MVQKIKKTDEPTSTKKINPEITNMLHMLFCVITRSGWLIAMDVAPVIYGLEDFQTRALTAQLAETEKINFLVGTQSLNNVNQVQLIEYDDDENGLVTKKSYSHPIGEVWKIASAPQTASLLATVHNAPDKPFNQAGCSLWRLPQGATTEELEESREELELVANLSENTQDPDEASDGVRWVAWSCDSDSKMATLTPKCMLLWDVRPDGSTAVVSSKSSEALWSSSDGLTSVGVGRWYPHQQAVQVAATHGSSVIAWDTRTITSAWSIKNAHAHNCRDLDFNPNLQYNLATCGDDCTSKFWDIRKPNAPLLVLGHHTHWVWSVRYNASYDQLVLTCSSDQRVALANLPSVAAMPFGDMQSEEGNNSSPDSNIPEGIIQTYEEHEDSVYAVEWSAGDFWTFASLSYDGRLVINRVPRAVKYKQFL